MSLSQVEVTGLVLANPAITDIALSSAGATDPFIAVARTAFANRVVQPAANVAANPAPQAQGGTIQTATIKAEEKAKTAIATLIDETVVRATHKDTLRFWGLIVLILFILAWWKPWQTTAVASASASVVAVAPIAASPQQVQVNVKIDPIKLEVTQAGKL